MGHASSRVYDPSSLQLADHICVWDKSLRPIRYQHHGIIRHTGNCIDTIQVAHIWSAIEDDVRAAQLDSRWRVTSLREFLNGRPLRDVRVVQYYTSFLGDLQMKWGEAHMAQSDIPEIAVARADWLVGQGVGRFNIVLQNCEHAAYWCKTGRQWSKQALIQRDGSVPFPASDEKIKELFSIISKIKKNYMENTERFAPDHTKLEQGALVYLKAGDRYLKARRNKRIYAIRTEYGVQPTAFHLYHKKVAYNVTHLSFKSAETGHFLYAPPLWHIYRGISVRYKNYGRGIGARNGHRFILSPNSELQSLHHERNWVCVDNNKENRLVLIDDRAVSLKFSIIPIEKAEIKTEVPNIPPNAFYVTLRSLVELHQARYMKIKNGLTNALGRQLTREERKAISKRLKEVCERTTPNIPVVDSGNDDCLTPHSTGLEFSRNTDMSSFISDSDILFSKLHRQECFTPVDLPRESSPCPVVNHLLVQQ